MLTNCDQNRRKSDGIGAWEPWLPGSACRWKCLRGSNPRPSPEFVAARGDGKPHAASTWRTRLIPRSSTTLPATAFR